ncbi:MAG TPA: serine/threonine-protein kinase [Gemmatimonadales bacterium]|jgi:serine/threonine protein kinase|nr:serine/threonine-protein kinase [Gemmatimonadales bacterium]
MTDVPPRHTVSGSSPAAPGLPPAGTDPLLERLRAATLGEYDLYGELGRGGMATVYLAHELALDRKVAIKVMSPALTYGAGMIERFKREARTAAHLSHPNIIPVYAVREAGDLLYFVMKLVEGTPLDSIMKELGKLPIPMVEAILAQVGGAFGYAHRRGVIHRDIKPSNILIDEEGWAVVTDFGIAKVQESEALTQTGSAMGTPTYMSPEQCGGNAIDGRSDQYSLGVVAYEMLTGRPPFTGSTMALMYSHFHEAVPPIALNRPDCPEPLQAAVMRMLEKDPAARWPSMEEAVAALGARHLAHDDPTRSQLILLARSGTTHKIVSQVQTPRSPIPLGHTGARTAERRATRKRPGWLLAAGGAVAIVAVLLLRPRPAPPAAGMIQTQSVPPVSPAAGSSGIGGEHPSVPAHPEATAPSRSPSPPPGAKPPVSRAVTAAPLDTAAKLTAAPPPPPPPPPPPAPVPLPAASPAAQTPAPEIPAPNVTRDEKVEVTNVILAYARALEAGDLTQALRLYPGMPPEQRQGLEAFWKAGGTMRTRWTVSEVTVGTDVATARVQGSNSVSTARAAATNQSVSLRARLERRGTEWRLVALVN